MLLISIEPNLNRIELGLIMVCICLLRSKLELVLHLYTFVLQ